MESFSDANELLCLCTGLERFLEGGYETEGGCNIGASNHSVGAHRRLTEKGSYGEQCSRSGKKEDVSSLRGGELIKHCRDLESEKGGDLIGGKGHFGTSRRRKFFSS